MIDGRRPGRDDRARTEFEQFFREHYRGLRRYVHARWPQTDSDSIANEALTRAWRDWEKIKGEKIAWAKTTAKRLALDACRKPRELPLEPTEMNAQLTRAGLTTDIDHAQYWQALEDLPARFRKALFMHTCGYTNKDIARALGCKVSSVSSYISDARNLMAKQVGKRSRSRRPAGPAATGRLPRNQHDDEED